MGRLAGKVAVITGGSRGIGAAIAARYGRECASVAVVYRSDAAAAGAVVENIGKAGGRATAFSCDISNLHDIAATKAAIIAEFGGIDILVNNAGIYVLTVLGNTTEDVWDNQINANVKCAYFMAQAVLPEMQARGGGKIINIGSIAGETGMPSSAVDYATKGAIKLMTKALALDLGAHNIQVNSLSPGCVESDMNAGYRVEIEGFMEALQGRFGAGNPWMVPDDMAGTAVFLASSDSNMVTGANIMVDREYSDF